MLFYVITTLLIMNVGMSLGILEIFEDIEDFQGVYALKILMFMITVALFVMISIFFKFHINLILTNNTTLENLDKKRLNNTTTNTALNVFLFF